MSWIKRHKILAALAVLFVLMISVGAASGNKKPTAVNSATKPIAKTASQPQPESNYEIISEGPSGAYDRVTVYTKEKTDAKLIALNDMLLDRYKNGKTHLFIDYFDDKSAANGYFDKQLDPSISENEKNQLYSHFIASMTYNTDTGFKALVKQGENQQPLKNY